MFDDLLEPVQEIDRLAEALLADMQVSWNDDERRFIRAMTQCAGEFLQGIVTLPDIGDLRALNHLAHDLRGKLSCIHGYAHLVLESSPQTGSPITLQPVHQIIQLCEAVDERLQTVLAAARSKLSPESPEL
jgi:hypothetical protein